MMKKIFLYSLKITIASVFPLLFSAGFVAFGILEHLMILISKIFLIAFPLLMFLGFLALAELSDKARIKGFTVFLICFVLSLYGTFVEFNIFNILLEKIASSLAIYLIFILWSFVIVYASSFLGVVFTTEENK